MPLNERIAAFVAWVQGLKAVRVFVHYGAVRGPILASGLAFQALFAVFAGLWVGFSVAALVIRGDTRLQESIIGVLDEAVPGLVAADGEGSGAIDPSLLTQSAQPLTIASVVALAGLLFASLGWLDSARASVRTLFDLPAPTTNPVLQKLVDLALGLAFAALLLVAAGLTFAGSSATDLVLGWIGVGRDSVVGFVAARILSIVISVLVYAVALVGLYRILSGVKVPWRQLRGGVIIGSIGVAVLTLISGLLLGGATNNPLIGSFAVIAGLLIYYNFVCQIILIGASWMAVDVADDGIVLDEKVAAARLEAARELVAANEPAPPAKRGFFARLFRRRRPVPSDE